MRQYGKWMLAAASMIAAPAVVAAEPLENLRYALSGGTPNLDLRLRAENVDQGDFLKEADALTVRTRLGYTSGRWNQFDVAAEFEDVTNIGSVQYDHSPLPTAGRAGYSVIADPRGSELNQAWIRYAGIPDTQVKIGRQKLIFDNARWIGNVGWRQNEMTYDGYLVTNTSIPELTVNAAVVNNANNVLFGEFQLDGQFLNLAYAAAPWLKAVAYGYRIDFDDALPVRQDTQTIGLRLTGELPAGPGKLGYAAEYAHQSNFEDAPDVVDADYQLLELGYGTKAVGAKLGYEVLGSNDGLYGLQTPLATLHAHDGWADQFLNTPATGLRNTYASVNGTVGAWNGLLRYHLWDADFGGADYGDEIDVLVGYAINDAFLITAKFADYNADTFSVDTRKTWLMAEYKF